MVGFTKLWIINGTRTFENSTGSLNELHKKEMHEKSWVESMVESGKSNLIN